MTQNSEPTAYESCPRCNESWVTAMTVRSWFRALRVGEGGVGRPPGVSDSVPHQASGREGEGASAEPLHLYRERLLRTSTTATTIARLAAAASPRNQSQGGDGGGGGGGEETLTVTLAFAVLPDASTARA